jgi:peptide/nickel transport system substrate-binding protein
MMEHRLKSWAAVVVVVTLAAAGCSSSGKPSDNSESTDAAAPSTGTEAPSAGSSMVRIKDQGVTAKGGTVYVLQDFDFTSLDPANNYETQSQGVGRLIYRTLTFAKDTPGEELSVQPDLAESLGTPSDGGRTWTYTLREGLKYEDGKPITAQDVKYGVMRSFDREVFPDGATWMPDLLENDTGFESPYATPEKDLTSVETPDERTLVFHFSGPQSDADWIMSLPYTAPVPKAADTKEAYGDRPVSSGPYKIEDYRRDTSLSLARNPNWDAATDPNRPAHPDRFQFDLTADTASERLIKSEGNDTFAVPGGPTLAIDEFARLEDPAIKPRFVNGPTPCVEFLTMNTQTLKDPDVRRAIALAIDRQSLHTLWGGDLQSSVVDSLIPSDLPGFVAPDLGLAPAANPDEAKKLLAGKSVTPMRLVVTDSPSDSGQAEIDQIQMNLKAVGVEVVIDPKSDDELSALLDEVDGWDLAGGGVWCPDWPTATTMVLPLMGPNADGTSWGPSNFAKYFDPKYSDPLQELKSSPEDSVAVAKRAVDIANEIQTTAWPYLPTLQPNSPEVVGANVTNVGISPLLGQVDLNTLAVKK